MFKKIIAYQRLLLNSIPPSNKNSQNTFDGLFFQFLCYFILATAFSLSIEGYLNNILLICLPQFCLWMINRILYCGDRSLFETVPVKREYIVLNVFLLSVVIFFIGYIIVWFIGVVIIGSLFHISYLVFPQGFNQIIDISKVDTLTLFLLIMILFIGVALTFIKEIKYRQSSLILGFNILVYVFIGILAYPTMNSMNKMNLSPNSGKIRFLENFSNMPQGNMLLICVAITTVIICLTSVSIGCKLYVGKPNDTKQY